MACLENHQNTAGYTYHHTGNGNFGEALCHFLRYLIRSPAHDKTAYESHQKEYGTQFRKIPAFCLCSPYNYHNTGNESRKDQFFPDAKLLVFNVIRIHRKTAEIIAVNKALCRVGLDL